MMQVELAVLGYKCILGLVLNSLLCLIHLGRSGLSGKEMAANQLGDSRFLQISHSSDSAVCHF